MDKIILLEKYNDSNFFWKHLSQLIYNFDEIIDKYYGFEGNCIRIYENPIITKELLQEFITLYDLYEKKNNSLLYISSDLANEHNPVDFIFIGFDFGFVKDSSNIYSSIFNEVCIGKNKILESYQLKLNNFQLLPTLNVALKYMEDHRKLLNNCEDVEIDNDMNIFRIYKYAT